MKHGSLNTSKAQKQLETLNDTQAATAGPGEGVQTHQTPPVFAEHESESQARTHNLTGSSPMDSKPDVPNDFKPAMKRGFLNTPKARKQLENLKPVQDVYATSTTQLNDIDEVQRYQTSASIVSVAHESQAKKGSLAADFKPGLPASYKPPGYSLNYFQGANANDLSKMDPNAYAYATLPNPKQTFSIGGQTECWITVHAMRIVLATPGFPIPPLLPRGGFKIHRIASPGGKKGLGMFPARHIKAGELIIDERPLLVVPASSAAVDPALWAMGIVGDSSNGKKKGKKYTVRRLGTNGIAIEDEKFRDEGKYLLGCTIGGIYTAICDEISRINHSCSPNTSFDWNTTTFSVRIHAVRDIPVVDKITLAYTTTLWTPLPNAHPCACRPACDPARIRKGDACRALITKQISTIRAVPFRNLSISKQKKVLEGCVERVKEMGEDGMEEADKYRELLRYVVEGYACLGEGEKMVDYAKKLEGVCRAFGDSVDEKFLRREGVERTGPQKAGEIDKGKGKEKR
ncbi:hypothetical protein BDP27DRAFT_1481567 [Rhodocollybia butyracea]|uniref:SET domain-containing protein n=1 Tax=Rhodocollybia butyracea TaxID=206335 RepID=A0A9P5U2L3_9AGAR|nr:hypothetical protein BDP27DRAFT_1481567 [Rhodocollybia butyracea]